MKKCKPLPCWMEIGLGMMVGAPMIMLIFVASCSHVISVPPDAPVMLSCETVTSSPFVRQHGQWVKTSGKVTLHAGEVVVVLPATQP